VPKWQSENLEKSWIKFMNKIITSITVKLLAGATVAGLVSASACLGDSEPEAKTNTAQASLTNDPWAPPQSDYVVVPSEPGTNKPGRAHASATPHHVSIQGGMSTNAILRRHMHSGSVQTNVVMAAALARFDAARERMVTEQLAGPGRGITAQSVLDAMRKVPRQSFLPSEVASNAYVDGPLNIRYGRTMESPYVVASVAEQLASNPAARVLEIGTGSGYQTAVLSLLVQEVYTIETNSILARRAAVDLQNRGYTNNVFMRTGDAAQGWPEAAPFDAIIINDATDQIPETLTSQLKAGGQLIIPVDANGNLESGQKGYGSITTQVVRSVCPTPIPGNTVELPHIARAMPVQAQAPQK
jgi:protein-L-isoaspartate(D-aspartate) O-methyltransferase